MVPRGYCQCGCGLEAPIAKRTHTFCGHKKGEPIRYISGHNRRLSPREHTLNPETGCWEWARSLNGSGYGTYYNKGKKDGAHREYYRRYRGEIPPGMFVCHKCDNKKCVNPDHLFLGTNSDNIRDMVAKGKFVGWDKRGENGPAAKLTEGQVLDIRKRYSEGSARQVDLAREFGILQGSVSNIIHRRSWTHI